MPLDVLRRVLDPLRKPVVTSRYPAEAPPLPPASRGLPVVDPARCDRNGECVAVCPTAAILVERATWTIDAGRCVLCGACMDACPAGAITMPPGAIPVARTREPLVVTAPLEAAP
jgi:formate hydrogenlyase subunit 6/NADH:ubiquinone oxidoreductase subunit I